MVVLVVILFRNFYPRPPCGGRRRQRRSEPLAQRISIHALRAEGDYKGEIEEAPRLHFYPRPPCGGRRSGRARQYHSSLISIHALRAEGDLHTASHFNLGVQFLSTPSVRRATSSLFFGSNCTADFYPRPPCGGRRSLINLTAVVHSISIHALRAEGDRHKTAVDGRRGDFYPRPPCGGRPERLVQSVVLHPISIHALRAEGDPTASGSAWATRYFYPRPPCGGRPARPWCFQRRRRFLSTPSVRRATIALPVKSVLGQNFYPRPPCGGRRFSDWCALPAFLFLSTPSVRRATRANVDKSSLYPYFYPRPPCGGRHQKFTKYCLLLRHKHENSSF